MNFSNDISNFTSKALSAIEAAQKDQQTRIKQFLTDFLGEDVSKIEHIEFNNDTSKFFNLKAPDDIVKKFKDNNYLQE